MRFLLGVFCRRGADARLGLSARHRTSSQSARAKPFVNWGTVMGILSR